MSSVSSTAHQSFIIASTVLWGVYRSIGLDRVARLLVADHTRDAAFQLFCDLRTNSPKDMAFVKRHARALKPQTVIGWLAMLATLLSIGAYTAVVAAFSLGATVAAMNVLMVLSVCGGVTLACVLACCSAALLVGSFVIGCTAVGCGLAYTSLASTKFVLQSVGRLMLGGPARAPPQQQLPHAQSALPDDRSSTAQERENLDKQATEAGEAAAGQLRNTLEKLPGSSSRAAEIAMARLGVTLPPSNGSSDSSMTSDHRAPPLPSAAVVNPALAAVSPTATDAVQSPGSPPRQELPPSSFHQPKGFVTSSFLTPKKRSDADAAAGRGGSSLANGVTSDGSEASDTSQVPDLPGLMTDSFVGSPGRNTPIALSRQDTPEVPAA